MIMERRKVVGRGQDGCGHEVYMRIQNQSNKHSTLMTINISFEI